VTSYEQSPDHGDLERLAGELGQHDPNASRYDPAANENAPVKPNWRDDLFSALLAFTLIGAALLAFVGAVLIPGRLS
jgi:hypothetical protein